MMWGQALYQICGQHEALLIKAPESGIGIGTCLIAIVMSPILHEAPKEPTFVIPMFLAVKHA